MPDLRVRLAHASLDLFGRLLELVDGEAVVEVDARGDEDLLGRHPHRQHLDEAVHPGESTMVSRIASWAACGRASPIRARLFCWPSE